MIFNQLILDPQEVFDYSVEYWGKRVTEPHPKVFYVMKDKADLLVKAGVSQCLYDRYKHRRLGGHIEWEYVAVINDPHFEQFFTTRFGHLRKETSGTETYYAVKEIRDWIDKVQEIKDMGLADDWTRMLLIQTLQEERP